MEIIHLNGSSWYCMSCVLLMLQSLHYVNAYHIYNIEDSPECNTTIWLEKGYKSAAILKMTSKLYYKNVQRHCFITVKAGKHLSSGLLGVLEEVDLRRYRGSDKSKHYLAQDVCIDYVKITTPPHKSAPGTGSGVAVLSEEQCGTWSLSPEEVQPTPGHSKAIVGLCGSDEMCEPVEELQVEVVVGRPHERSYLWDDLPNHRHKGFVFVVTAYTFSYGGRECAPELRSCGEVNDRPSMCVHESLFCDGHLNCDRPPVPLVVSMDERFCHAADVWSGPMTVLAGPWMGAGLFLMLVTCALIYRKSMKARHQAPGAQVQQTQLCNTLQRNAPDFNSYAESYEVSSNLSSAHHMAIQVRVVCNPGGSQGMPHWKPMDLPPSYDALFPQGPPAQAVNLPLQSHRPQFAHTFTSYHGPNRSTADTSLINASESSSGGSSRNDAENQAPAFSDQANIVGGLRENCVVSVNIASEGENSVTISTGTNRLKDSQSVGSVCQNQENSYKRSTDRTKNEELCKPQSGLPPYESLKPIFCKSLDRRQVAGRKVFTRSLNMNYSEECDMNDGPRNIAYYINSPANLLNPPQRETEPSENIAVNALHFEALYSQAQSTSENINQTDGFESSTLPKYTFVDREDSFSINREEFGLAILDSQDDALAQTSSSSGLTNESTDESNSCEGTRAGSESPDSQLDAFTLADPSSAAEDGMTSSGISGNTYYQSCSEYNESNDESAL